MRTFFKLAAGLVLPALVLAGCSEAEAEAEPEITYPSQSVTESTEAPTEEPTTALVPPTKEELYPYPKPVMPEAAKARTKEGAMAFAVYVAEIYAYSIAIRDPQPLMDVCTDVAEFCKFYKSEIERSIETDTYRVGYAMQDLEPTGALEGGTTDRVEWGAQVVGYTAPYVLREGAEGETTRVAPLHFVFGVEVAWLDGWKVEEAQALPYEEVYDD
ncbi:MAG: DUF6318 family protein [Actinomycetaceae bacterium]|nr:DUF6318 family protein [Actinomycetaceae bacterium]